MYFFYQASLSISITIEISEADNLVKKLVTGKKGGKRRESDLLLVILLISRDLLHPHYTPRVLPSPPWGRSLLSDSSVLRFTPVWNLPDCEVPPLVTILS